MNQPRPGSRQDELDLMRLLLLLALVLAAAYTFAPFNISFSWTEFIVRTREAMDLTATGGVFGVTSHFVVFFILGLLIVLVHERALNYGSARIAVTAAVLCVGLEFGQLLVDDRHARLSDLVVNFAGVWCGAKAAILWPPVRRLQVAFQETSRLHSIRLQAGVIILAAAVWLFAGLRPLLGGLEMDWNQGYHLLVGNESDRSRPWLGEIRYIGAYGRALDAAQVVRAYETVRAPRTGRYFRDMELLVGYNFMQANVEEVVPEGLLRSSELSMPIPYGCAWSNDGGGILLVGETLLASHEPASELTAAIVASGAFSVEAWIRPLNETMTGPARIVSLSGGIAERNYTLAQELKDGVFRVRNGISGTNGVKHQLKAKGAVDNELQHIVAVYDHGVSSMFRDGRRLSPTIDLREPAVNLGLGTGGGGRVVSSLLLAITFGLPAYSILTFLRPGRLRHLMAMSVTFCVASLPYAATCVVVGGPWRPDLFFWMGGTLLIAYPLCFNLVRHRVGRDALLRVP